MNAVFIQKSWFFESPIRLEYLKKKLRETLQSFHKLSSFGDTVYTLQLDINGIACPIILISFENMGEEMQDSTNQFTLNEQYRLMTFHFNRTLSDEEADKFVDRTCSIWLQEIVIQIENKHSGLLGILYWIMDRLYKYFWADEIYDESKEVKANGS